MKTLLNHEFEIQRYESPRIQAIEIEAREILCDSVWNDGSISDEEENWNVLEF